MSDYTDSVLAKYPDAGAAVRKALADALAAAEKAQQATPGSTPVGVSSLKPTGAMASELAEWARADKAFAASKVDADTILASEGKRIAETEGLRLDEAQAEAWSRYPLTTQRWNEGR
jgi:hypothetical protein